MDPAIPAITGLGPRYMTRILPQRGQFIAIWEYNHLLWTEVWRFNNESGEYERHNDDVDEFEEASPGDYLPSDPSYDLAYIITANNVTR